MTGIDLNYEHPFGVRHLSYADSRPATPDELQAMETVIDQARPKLARRLAELRAVATEPARRRAA